MPRTKQILVCLVSVSVFGCADDSDGLTPGQGDAATVVLDSEVLDDGIIHEDPPMDASSPDAVSPDGGNDAGPDTGPDAGPADDGVCVPDCWLKACGDDGCGGTCGTCLPGASCNGEGRCDCPASTCGSSVCGVSSCGANCGTCEIGQVCDNGACVSSCPNGAVACRDLAYNFLCEGQLGRGLCATDMTRTAACACDPASNNSLLECEDCYINAPIHCRNGDCLDSEQCNEWTGKCEPAGLPNPPPGGEVGDPCMDDSECRSFGAHGSGSSGGAFRTVPQCLSNWNGGYCMSYCNAPPGGFFAEGDLHQANCPSGSLCLPVSGVNDPDPPGQGACSKECFTDSDCREAEGYFCRHEFPLPMSTPRGVCAPSHCRTRGCASYVCGC